MSVSSARCAIISMRCADTPFVASRFVLPASLLCQRGCAQRRVTFRAEDGATLSGAYYEPSRRPAPGIVLLHMLRRSHADWDAAASQLSDAGFAVVALDYRGGDELGAYAIDVRAAKAFLRERPEVMPGQHRHCRRLDWRQPRGARRRRRSRRAVDRAALARDSTTRGCAPKRR